jgi:lipopolysaccharide transport system ATP-binding protein
MLFLSHNLDSLRKFCTTAVLLDSGKMIDKGNTEKIINLYASKHLETKSTMVWESGVESYNKEVILHKIYLHDDSGLTRSRFDTTEKIGISMEYEVKKDEVFFTHGINVFNQENVNIFNSHDVTSLPGNQKRKKGRYISTAWIPGNLLPEGIFSISVAIFLPNPLDVLIHQHTIISFETYTDFSKLSARGNYADDFPGVIRPLLQWDVVENN